MLILHWELSVLSRAIAYKNLSSAADNIGVSQPQLSRIVAKLEAQMGLTLLERGSKRHSSWTSAAFRLAELYSGSASALERQLRTLAGQSVPKQLKVGTLEGLSGIAADYCRELFKKVTLEVIELDIHDLHELEQRYFKGDLDLAFFSRLPGRNKPRFSRLLGSQTIESRHGNGGVVVMSPFERQTHKDSAGREIAMPKAGSRVLVSNSLAVRRRWIENFGGSGLIPSSVRSSGGTKGSPVYLVATESIASTLWNTISKIAIR